jgi:hypothetical protein
MLNTPAALVSNHGLESLEDLNRRLETDGSWLDATLTGRLRHDRPDQEAANAKARSLGNGLLSPNCTA